MMTPAEITQILRATVEAHGPNAAGQWYVDKFVIDCDADEFWKVIEHALTQLPVDPARMWWEIAANMQERQP